MVKSLCQLRFCNKNYPKSFNNRGLNNSTFLNLATAIERFAKIKFIEEEKPSTYDYLMS
jgi:hypothetical protein